MRNNLIKRSYFKEAIDLEKGKKPYGVQKLVGENFNTVTNSNINENGKKIYTSNNKSNNKSINHINHINQNTALSVSGEKIIKKFKKYGSITKYNN